MSRTRPRPAGFLPGAGGGNSLKNEFMKVRVAKMTAGFVIGLGVIVLAAALTHRRRPQSKDQIAVGSEPVAGVQPLSAPAPPAARPVAPFIVKDTENDSPGTNIVTRIVTFTAEIGGSPPPALQWGVDKGAGFADIPGATNATFRIGNAQVSDAGFYSLVATNSAGRIRTSPQQLIVTEGED